MLNAEQSPPSDLLAVARIVDAYGIKGWIKLEPFSPEASALFEATEWWLQKAQETPSIKQCQHIRWHGKGVVASLQGITDRAQAEDLKGRQVLVSRQKFPALEKDEYYWTDLIGCDAINEDQTLLGKVVNVMDNGAHAILEIKNKDGLIHWVPFVAAHVGQVSLAAKRIEVSWLPPQ